MPNYARIMLEHNYILFVYTVFWISPQPEVSNFQLGVPGRSRILKIFNYNIVLNKSLGEKSFDWGTIINFVANIKVIEGSILNGDVSVTLSHISIVIVK